MKTLLKPLARLKLCSIVLLLLAVNLHSSNLLAQSCSLACRGTTNLSLDMNCEAMITPLMILQDQGASCPGGSFEVTVSNASGPIPTSPMVTGDYIGQTLTVSIKDLVSLNTCWGYLLVEDKLGPVIESCPTELEFACSEFNVFPGPTFIDACEGPVEPVLLSETITPLACDPLYIKEITRTYTAFDSRGFAAPECTVVYKLLRIALDDVVCPPSYTVQEGHTLSCDGKWDTKDCVHATFAGEFAPANWTTTIVGTGTNGAADATAAPATMTFNATTDGTAGADTNTDFCTTIPCDGYLSFDWHAYMNDVAGPGARFLNDEAAYVLNGVETLLTTDTNAQDASGFVNIAVEEGDAFCFRIWSMNRNAWTSLDVTTLLLSGQYGLVLDTDTNGDGVLDAEANGTWDDDGDGYPDPLEVGVPTLGGVALFPISDIYCNSGTFYSDLVLPTNSSCKIKIMRSWEVREWWCGQEIVHNCLQVIEIGDDIAPVISCLDTDQCVGYTQVTTNTSMYGVVTIHGMANCGAEYFPAMPEIDDNCSTTFDVDFTYPGGFLDNYDGTEPMNLMMGQNVITVTVYDQCYNSSVCTYTIDVVDNTPPTAICDEFTVVSLTSNGEAKVYAETFDDGSHDDCILKKTLVRRMDPTCDCETPKYPDMVYLGEYDDHLYYVSKDSVNWYMARDLSEAMGGYLVRLGDMAESNWVYTAANGFDMNQYYIDMSDQDCDGVFTYSDGTIPTYTNWAVNQPSGNGQFVLFRNNTAFWNDVRGENRMERYVMELENPCSFSHSVKFCCEDVGEDVMVVMRVVDVYGNWNECMVTVEVQDKFAPTITCPNDTIVECDFVFTSDFSIFGTATAHDNCDDNLVINETVQQNINQCNVGTITRTFSVTDGSSPAATCQQVITVRNSNPFKPSNIQWPVSPYTMNDCIDPDNITIEDAGTPTFIEDQCDLVGANHTDEVFYFNNTDGNSCFKILRKWRVIEWCQEIDTNGDGIPDTNPIWEFTQEIKVNNFVGPDFVGDCEPIWVCTYDTECQGGYIDLTKSATDDCTLTGNLVWTAHIDLDSNGSFDGQPITTTGGTIDISGTYPLGTHTVTWTVADKCGNVETCVQEFKILSCKAPTPYCINGLAVDLMPVDTTGDNIPDFGMVELWATDFDKGSHHACGYDVVLSFSSDITETNMTFDCTMLPNGIAEDVEVMIFTTAVDAAGEPILDHDGNPLQAFCNTFVNVQDNMDVCPDVTIPGGGGTTSAQSRIAGQVSTEDGRQLPNVFIDLAGADMNSMTDTDGYYEFPVMTNGGAYLVHPEKEDIHVSGVSTLDLVMIQRHILNVESLDSPYKMIAADANKDNAVTSSDLVDIRKLILEYYSEYPNNVAWRFVDKNYSFIDSSNPLFEAFTEDYSIPQLNADMTIDFVGMKVGDVNTSVTINGLTGNIEARTGQKYQMEVGAITATAGTNVRIPVYTLTNDAIYGYQFALNYAGSDLQIVGIEGGQLDMKADNYRIVNNTVSMSWSAGNARAFNREEALFYVVAELEGQTANTANFEIIGANFAPEVYNASMEIVTPVLVQSIEATTNFELFQNTPNPFKGETQISFRLPAQANATLTIRDITGKVIYIQKGDYSAGVNTLRIDQSQIATSGVLYYTIEAGQYIATKKMVILD